MMTTSHPNLTRHNGTWTVSSARTGKHRTFQIKTAKNGKLAGKRILSILNGPDNEGSYLGVAFVSEEGDLMMWRRYRGTGTEATVRCFYDLLRGAQYAAHRESSGYTMQGSTRCRRCNRKLTTPESIESGIGPVCASQ